MLIKKIILLSIFALTVILIPCVIPAFAFSNGQEAILELGQPNDGNPFDSGDKNNGGVSARSLYGPYGITFDSAGNLWVADTNNNRILMYLKADLATSGNPATVVIGQGGFTTNNPGAIQIGSQPVVAPDIGVTAHTLSGPSAIAFDKQGNLWVADTHHNRILMFPKSGTTISNVATQVLGQPDFSSHLPSNTFGLTNPTGIVFDQSENLWVADHSGYIMMFPKSGTTISSTWTLTLKVVPAGPLSMAEGIAFDKQGNLWVTDAYNNRVLMFEKGTGFTSGQTHAIVLGQPGSVTGITPITKSTLDRPYGITFDSVGNLWVVDSNNYRILMFEKGTGFTSGQASMLVLGHGDFVTRRSNSITASTLDTPQGITFDSGGNLWVSDTGNSRVMMYSSAGPIHHVNCSLDPKLCQILNPRNPDPCIVNGHLICKVDFGVFKEIIPCYDQVDGPLCPLPHVTKETLLEIKQEFPPLKQVQAGIDLKNLVAAKGNVLITNDARTYPISVTENTANSLLSNTFWHKFP